MATLLVAAVHSGGKHFDGVCKKEAMRPIEEETRAAARPTRRSGEAEL
jgi:hypothetical protein